MSRARRLLAALPMALLAVAPAAARAGDGPAAGGHDCVAPTGFERDLCASDDYERADTELDLAYRTAVRRLREHDPLDAACSRCGEAAEKLLAAQRAWTGFRDAECQAVYALNADGAERNLAQMECLSARTRERTRQLREQFLP